MDSVIYVRETREAGYVRTIKEPGALEICDKDDDGAQMFVSTAEWYDQAKAQGPSPESIDWDAVGVAFAEAVSSIAPLLRQAADMMERTVERKHKVDRPGPIVGSGSGDNGGSK